MKNSNACTNTLSIHYPKAKKIKQFWECNIRQEEIKNIPAITQKIPELRCCGEGKTRILFDFVFVLKVE